MAQVGTSRRNGQHDLETVLREAGPYFHTDPDDGELYERLDRFGELIWRIPSPTQFELARQLWVDWIKEHTVGVPDPWRVVQCAIEAGRDNAAVVGPLRWYTVNELAEMEAPASLIGDVIAEHSFSVMHGPYGSGKTFVALDMALSVATGRSWHGLEVSQGPVAYVIAEGQGGFAKRIDAWIEVHGNVPDAPFRILPQSVNLLDPASVTALLSSIEPWKVAPKLLIIDTVFRCFGGGDEHSPKDMGGFIAGVDRVRLTTGASCLALHHPGHKEGTRSRGHSSLEQAADTVIRIERSMDSGLITMSCEKQKDGPHFEKRRFHLTPRSHSLVVESAVGSFHDDLSATAESTLAALHQIATSDGATYTEWMGATEKPSSTFARIIRNLLSTKHIEKRTDKYFVTEHGKNALGVAS